MRKLALAAVIIFATGPGVALAADAPISMPFSPPLFHTWNGFYFGGNVGGGSGNFPTTFSTTVGGIFATADKYSSGFLGGVQLGYNWQTGSMVFGVETDFQFSGLKGTLTAPCPAGFCAPAITATFSQSMPWFGTVRGRVGYASDGWLFYVTGGYAYAQINTDAFASDGITSATFEQRAFRSGWTLGGGIEIALNRNWSAKFEYLHIDLGSQAVSMTFPALPAVNADTRLQADVIRVGANFRY